MYFETVVSILVVDDQTDLRETLKQVLTANGYQVITASHGQEALALLATHSINLIISDIEMPHLNGYQLYEQVQTNPKWLTIPFIFLTGRNFDSDIRYGKALGVDDYLTKPFEIDDLLAAVQGKLRRANLLAQHRHTKSSPASASEVITIGELKINSAQHRVKLHGQAIKLSAREFVLLQYFAQRANQVITPPELIRTTHNYDTDSIEAGNLLRPLIRSLRRKLGNKAGELGCIENVRGVGYRLIAP